MNKYISVLLMQKLLNLPYVDKLGGIVQTIQKTIPQPGERSIIKRIPVSPIHKAPDSCKILNNKNLPFIPESKLKGMIYFEDNGVSVDLTRRHTAINFYTSSIRLVCWLNQKNIRHEFDVELSSMAINQIIMILTGSSYQNEAFNNIKVRTVGVPALNSDIFSAYDYDESENQFLMPPYDFFAIDFNVKFGVARNCAIILDPDTSLPKCCR